MTQPTDAWPWLAGAAALCLMAAAWLLIRGDLPAPRAPARRRLRPLRMAALAAFGAFGASAGLDGIGMLVHAGPAPAEVEPARRPCGAVPAASPCEPLPGSGPRR